MLTLHKKALTMEIRGNQWLIEICICKPRMSVRCFELTYSERDFLALGLQCLLRMELSPFL